MVLGEHELALECWSLVSDASAEAPMKQHAEIEAARAAYRLGRSVDAHTHIERARGVRPISTVGSVQLDALEAQVLLWLDHRTAAGAEFAARALQGAEEMVEAGSRPHDLATDGRMA